MIMKFSSLSENLFGTICKVQFTECKYCVSVQRYTAEWQDLAWAHVPCFHRPGYIFWWIFRLLYKLDPHTLLYLAILWHIASLYNYSGHDWGICQNTGLANRSLTISWNYRAHKQVHYNNNNTQLKFALQCWATFNWVLLLF